MPSDFVTSNVDLAATVFDLVGITPPAGYVTDGLSYIDDVVQQIASPSTAEQSSCLYKYIDIVNSHSIVRYDCKRHYALITVSTQWALAVHFPRHRQS